jgi:hypothetical protein
MTNLRITDPTNSDRDMNPEDFTPVLQDAELSEPASHVDLSASKSNSNNTPTGFNGNFDRSTPSFNVSKCHQSRPRTGGRFGET